MTQAQWHRVRDLFEQALDEHPPDLSSWLQRQESADGEVRAEVASLLQHHSQAGAFLVEPVAERVPDILGDEPGLAPGQAVGPYTVVREIGRGGMGRVYLARDARLGRTVALKALPPELANDPSQRERLRREARAAAALTHPGICTVYALEEVDGALFIATEYVDGRTLRDQIASGARLSGLEALELARELAAALASAHARGIAHRDLKPENVMRASDGRLKVLDFGLARLDGAARAELGDGRATMPGALMGTPAYMAPEQLNGQPAGARADVFAFGVLISELVCGTHPFDARSPLAIVARVLEGEPTPLERCARDVPRLLAAVVARCLRKDPDERFASAGDIVQALATGVRPEPQAESRARAAGWWRAHQVIVIGLYLMASVLAWQVKEWLGGAAVAVFIAIGIASTVGGVFRGHLVFTERVNGDGMTGERRRAGPVTMGVDLAIAAGLALDGLMLVPTREVAAVLTLGLSVGIGLTRLLVEPSTTRATFGDAP
jgi:predicted Ser/Thr protein kinase